MLLRRHERPYPPMKQANPTFTPAPVQIEARDPGITLNVGGLLGVTIGKGNNGNNGNGNNGNGNNGNGGKPTSTQAPTSAPAPPASTTQPPANTTPSTTKPTQPSNNPTTSHSNSGNGGNPHTQDPTPSTTPNQPNQGGGGEPPANGGGNPTDTPGGTGPGAGETPGGSNDGGQGSGGSSTGGGVTGSNGRPGVSNLSPSDFPDQVVGNDSNGRDPSTPDRGTAAAGTNDNGAPVGGLGVSSGRGGTSTTSSGGSSPTNIDGGGKPVEATSASKGFPQGAGIAIGIICALLFLLGLVILLRRHRKAKREERLHNWWFSRKRNSKSYNDDTHVVQIPPAPSARSSFATTVDHSAQFAVNFSPVDMPAVPPMAEIRRSRNDLTYPMAASVESGQGQRVSVGSANSHNSQFFFINHRPSLDTSVDHSAAHFSGNPLPSPAPERFAFPKPPSDTASDRKSGYSDSSSRPPSAASGTEETTKTYHTPDTSPTPPDHQNLPAFAANPFSDPVPAPESTASHTTATTDPFSDSTVSTVHGTVEETIPIPVLRPFTSTLHDEVTLVPGDNVKVLQIFDDGWALVDKLAAGVAIQRGLCPLACLR